MIQSNWDSPLVGDRGIERPDELGSRVADLVLRKYPDSTQFSAEWGEILLMEGLLATWHWSGNRRYGDYVAAWLDHHITNGFQINRSQQHPTSWGPLVPALDLYEHTGRPKYKSLVEQACNYICHQADRLANGALQHYTGTKQVWIDTLYYTAPALTKLGVLAHVGEYVDQAILQILTFAEVLGSLEDGLFYHMYDEATGTHSRCFWGRGNGWAAMALVDSLETLPEVHPRRGRLLEILELMFKRVLETQDRFGAWHTVLDRPDTYAETSATSMLLYSLSKGIRHKWVTRSEERAPHKAWQALSARVTQEGRVVGVSGITSPGDFDHYQLVPVGEYTWGTGSFLKTIEEYLRLTRSSLT